MIITCRRPGCSSEAEVCISYNAESCQIWIDNLIQSLDGSQALCHKHVSKLSAPRGWVIVDRRTSQTSILHDGENRKYIPRRKRKLSQRWVPLEQNQQLFQDDLFTTQSLPEVSVLNKQANLGNNTSVQDKTEARDSGSKKNDESKNALKSKVKKSRTPQKGGLLGKALSSAGNQKSVLTELNDQK